MLDIGKESSLPSPKCYFSSTTLPAYLDTSQQPTKRAPFSLVHKTPYYHSISILTPSANKTLLSTLSTQKSSYARLKLSLLSLLTGDFFNQKIKTGNVLLHSAPLHCAVTSSSATFTLIEGVLCIICDNAMYERAGLSGTRIPDPHGRKHAAKKWKIEMNLRLPSMLKGKKGFERLLRAAEDVFAGEIDWVYYDVAAKGVVQEEKCLGGEVEVKQVIDETTEVGKVLVPPIIEEVGKRDQDEVMELVEWISLAAVGSPRVREGDEVDEVISRYKTVEGSSSTDVSKMTWKGYLPGSFVAEVFAQAVIGGKETWFAALLQGVEEGRSVVVFKTDDGRALSWECEG